jgi:transposase
MEQASKTLAMANGKKMIIPKPVAYFTTLEKEHIIQEYLSSQISKNELWKKYTGKTDHGRLLNWMRKLGYSNENKQEGTKFVVKSASMQQKKQEASQQVAVDEKPSLSQGQAKIEELERQLTLAQHELARTKKELELAQIKSVAYAAMIDLAEKEFNIPIRKKSKTKP